MNISTLIQVLENIKKDQGDLKVYRADDEGTVNLVTSIPSICIAKLLSVENPVVVSEEQLERIVEDKYVVIR